MAVHYSKHAIARLAERSVSTEDVAYVLDKPDAMSASYGGRFLAERNLRGRKLRVIYTAIEDEITVITVYWIGERQ